MGSPKPDVAEKRQPLASLAEDSAMSLGWLSTMRATFPPGSGCLCCGPGTAVCNASGLCNRCLSAPPYAAGSLADTLNVHFLGLYQGALASRIGELKYRGITHWAERMGRALAVRTPNEWRAAALVPVPLHPDRLAERGFNQSALIGRSLSRHTRLRLRDNLLDRGVATRQQAKLGRAERSANVAQAFQARSAPSTRVVLIDDVWTTGETCRACTQALSARGHHVLGALVLALRP